MCVSQQSWPRRGLVPIDPSLSGFQSHPVNLCEITFLETTSLLDGNCFFSLHEMPWEISILWSPLFEQFGRFRDSNVTLEYLHFCQSSYNKYSRKLFLKGDVDQERNSLRESGRAILESAFPGQGGLLEQLLGKLHGLCHHRDIAGLLEGPILYLGTRTDIWLFC